MTAGTDEIARALDARIEAWRRDRRPARFWVAGCAEAVDAATLAAAGFANYPLRPVAFDDGLFFFERLAGARVAVQEGRAGSFAHTWCLPALAGPGDIDRVPAAVDGLPLWKAFEAAARAAGGPIPTLAFTPLDWACDLCGTEAFFLLLHDDPAAAAALLARLGALYVSARARLRAAGIDCRMVSGFPGVYVNDLQAAFLSPAHLAELLLPLYAGAAAACGPLILALNCADAGVMRDALALPPLLGCAFDRRLPLEAIAAALGDRLFVLYHYCYLPGVDRPTPHRGLTANPIVAGWSREIDDVFRVVAPGHSLLVHVERPTFAEVCAVRDRHEQQTWGQPA